LIDTKAVEPRLPEDVLRFPKFHRVLRKVAVVRLSAWRNQDADAIFQHPRPNLQPGELSR
jgi:hypothetical protein